MFQQKLVVDLKTIEHLVVGFVVMFGAQVAINGVPLDLFTAAGRTAAASAIGMAIWRAVREDLTGTTTGGQ